MIRRLEDAGATLAMLPPPKNSRPLPPGSSWQDVIQSFWDVAGHAEVGSVEDRQRLLATFNNRVNFQADRAAVDRLDEVLGWFSHIDAPHKRKVVAARMLVHPVSLRHLHSWSNIGKALDVHYSTAQRWFNDGVLDIMVAIENTPKRKPSRHP